MPRKTLSIEIAAPCKTVFDLFHNYDLRLEWDSMLKEAVLLNGAEAAGKGVEARCVGKWRSAGIAMVTEYVSFDRGRVAAVKLTRSVPFFEHFAASIRHEAVSAGRSRVIYTYSFRARPKRFAFVLEPIMNFVLRGETRARLKSLRDFLEGAGA
jgi:hypothetical protein